MVIKIKTYSITNHIIYTYNVAIPDNIDPDSEEAWSLFDEADRYWNTLWLLYNDDSLDVETVSIINTDTGEIICEDV